VKVSLSSSGILSKLTRSATTTCFAMTPHFSLAEENQGVMAGRLRLSCRLRIDKPYSGSNDQTCDQLFERTAQVEARWLTRTREIC